MAVANEVEHSPAVKPVTGGTPQNGAVQNGAVQNGSQAVKNGQHHPTPVEVDRLYMMMLIRRFEERTFQEYQAKGQKIGGFCHLYSGQEAIAVGTAAIFDKSRDYLINGYRCHGHSLALGMSPRAGMAELFGKATGCSKGKGGSMHFFDSSVGNMGGHGIVGGQIPLGTGMAFSQAYKKTGGVTFCFMGDGAINQGTFNESLNLASLYKLPCIFVVENNGMAMGTQVERASAEKDLAKRGSGFAMPHWSIDANDVDTVMAEFSKAMERGRKGQGPSFIVANTYRFRGHSMSDPMKYRTKEEAARAKERDPISLYSQQLLKKGLIAQKQVDELLEKATAEINAATEQADNDPHPALEDRFNDALAEKYPYQPAPGTQTNP